MTTKHVDVSIEISGDGISLSFTKQNVALVIDDDPLPFAGYLLKESGNFLLSETNDKFELESI